MPPFLDRVANRMGFVRAVAVVQKESAADGLNYVSWEATQGASPPPSSEDYLGCYSATDWVYCAVTRRADAIAGVPLRFWRGPSELHKTEITSGLPDLFWKPNPKMGGEEFLRVIVQHLDLVGTAFIELVRRNAKSPVSASNPIVEMYPLMPNRMQILRDHARGVFGYRQWSKYGNDKIEFAPDQIAMIRYLDPADIDGYGLSPLAAARRKVALDLNATAFNSSFFSAGGEPGGLLIKKDGRLTKEDVKRIREAWMQAHSGPNKAHRIGILDEGMEYKQIALSQKDMQFIETMKFSGEAILRVYGVPPVVAGVLDNANYAISLEQKKLFWTLTLLPVLSQIAGQIDIGVCSTVGPDVWCEFDRSAVEDLKESEDTRANRARTLVDSQILTINEVRAEYYGREPVPWGDEPPAPAGAPFMLRAVNRPAVPVAKSYAADARKVVWDAFVKRLDPQEASMKRACGAYFTAQRVRLLKRLGGEKAITKASIPSWLSDNDSDWWGEEAAEAWAALYRHIRRAIADGVASVDQQYGGDGGDDFSWEDPAVVNFLRKKELRLGSDINTTTYEGLKRILADSTEAGETIAQLSKRIGEYYDDMAQYRAERIARTEVVGALNFGTIEGYAANGYEKKGWLAQMDQFVRDTHAEASRRYEDDPIPLDQKFHVGDASLMYPGDPAGDVGEIVHCRCTLLPYAE